MRAGFHVHGKHMGSSVGKCFCVSIGIHNHQMHIQSFLCFGLQWLHYGKSERNVGYKNTIHHIYVKPVGFTLIDHVNFFVKFAKIGREDGGSYHSRHRDKVKFIMLLKPSTNQRILWLLSRHAPSIWWHRDPMPPYAMP